MGYVMDYWKIQDFLETLVPPRHAVVQRMEEEARADDFPIIGPVSGQVCYLMARLIGAQRVFELGSGYGYSTAWFAQAVRENGGGAIWHVVWDKELSQRAQAHLQAMGLDDLVHYHVGEAIEKLTQTPGPFDIIFMDIDKVGYPVALPHIRARLRPGGLLIVDNMLWDGRIADENEREPETEAIRTLALAVARDPAWTSIIVPVRDGVLVARFNG